MRLGASAGASVFPDDGTTYEALLADADHSMYRDKAARRGHLGIPRTPAPADFITTDMPETIEPIRTRERRGTPALLPPTVS